MDIDYLRDIGKVDSFPLSIDSSLRDKRIYPTPAEYEINFDTPFTNVVGFDVLDATIPNTMYVVDTHNRMLSFVIHLSSSGLDAGRALDEYFSDLSQAGDFVSIWDDARYSGLGVKLCGSLLKIDDIPTVDPPEPGTPVVIVDRDVTLYPYPAEQVQSAGLQAIPIDTGTSYRVTTDGSDYYLQEFTETGRRFGPGTVRIDTVSVGSEERILVCATRSSSAFGEQVFYATATVEDMLETPLGHRQRMHFPEIADGQLVSVTTYGAFRVDGEFFRALTNAPKADVSPAGQAPDPDNPFNLEELTYHHELQFHNMLIDMGNHDVPSLIEAIELAMPTYKPPDAGDDDAEQPMIVLTTTSLLNDPNNPNFERKRKIRFESAFRFWMDMEKSTIKDIIGFSELAEDVGRDYSPYRIGKNLRVFEALPYGQAGNVYALETPGLISLLGERLVVLRCPQIEDHAFPSLSHGRFSAGLGVFKLYEQTVAHLRFDFTKLTRLDFHPIGKLHKLRLRFERLNGQTYNFKGVDHHLFISVKFIIPRSDRTLPPPHARLNPDYDPNIMRYVVERRRERDESDTESDEDLLHDREHVFRFHENRRKFMLGEEMRRWGVADGGDGYDGDDGSGGGGGG
eukprot:jgi/Tetstr1/464217/TSEL_009022.t1